MSSTLITKLSLALLQVFGILGILYLLCYGIRFISETIQKVIGQKSSVSPNSTVVRRSSKKGTTETRTVASIVSGIIAVEKGDFKKPYVKSIKEL